MKRRATAARVPTHDESVCSRNAERDGARLTTCILPRLVPASMTTALPALQQSFARAFERREPATWLVRAPGRVNVIGEHTDYNDLPVLPIALQREVRVLLAPRDDARVRLCNVDARYGPREFECSAEIAPFEQGDWGNYAKAAVQLFARELRARRGFDALVASTLPPAAGLSSSSALVVACALALSAANAFDLPALELAERCARAERYVGTNSGGMDQTACLAGRADHALKIDFAPLRVEAVPLPSTWRFIVAHSLVLADKSGAARGAYNARRLECENALAVVARSSELDGTERTFPRLLARYGAEQLSWIATRALEPGLLARFRHVIGEAARVERARRALLAPDAETFGALMNASHESLVHDFEVSHVELDRLVACARANGALGARLTGAGFGGCIVALTSERDAERVCDGLRRDFYATRTLPAGVAEAMFVVRACDGASLTRCAEAL